MKEIADIALGSAIAKVRVHPSARRLVAFSAARDEISLLGWDSGGLQVLSKFGTGREYGVPTFLQRKDQADIECGMARFMGDVAYHPSDDLMAIVGLGRPIVLYRVSDGSFIKAIDDVSEPDEIMYDHASAIRATWPAEDRGFRAVEFAGSGRILLAVSIQEPGTVHGKLRAYDVFTGNLIETADPCDSCVARHPAGELIATVSNSQTGARIRFYRFSEPSPSADELTGSVISRIRVSNHEDKWGFFPCMLDAVGMAFNLSGDTLALIGGTPGDRTKRMDVLVYDFPSLEERYIRSINRKSMAHDERGDMLPWLPIERVSFDPDGRRLFVPLASGRVTAVDAASGKDLRTYKAHEDTVTTIDIRACDRVAATGSLDSHVKLWRI